MTRVRLSLTVEQAAEEREIREWLKQALGADRFAVGGGKSPLGLLLLGYVLGWGAALLALWLYGVPW